MNRHISIICKVRPDIYNSLFISLETQVLQAIFVKKFEVPKLGQNSVLNKGKSAIPPLFNEPEVLSSASDKAKLFAKTFSNNFNLDDPGISLLVHLLELI